MSVDLLTSFGHTRPWRAGMASNDHLCFLCPNSESADARRQALQA